MARRKTVAEQELDEWVAAEAKYIQQRANVDFDRQVAATMQLRLENIGKALCTAEKESVLLVGVLHRNNDKYIPASFESECGRCRNSVVDALVAQKNAADKLLRHIQTNAPAGGHDLHRAALEAAYEYCCGQSKPRAARGLAGRILREAGVPETEWGCDKSISNWLGDIRSDRA